MNPQMAEVPEHSTQGVRSEEGVKEETAKRNEPLKMATNSPEEEGEASSMHLRPQKEESRSHEDRADHITPPRSLEIHASPQIFKCWQDDVKESEVEDFVHEAENPTSLKSQVLRPGDADCGAWVSPSGPRCPASFGDHGTTATAGAFGQLVQFSTYLGAGNSGMFSADHWYTNRPYAVTDRAKNLLYLASDPFDKAQREIRDDMFGLKFLNLEPSLSDHPPPRLKWFQYRWPRYEYDKEYFDGMKNLQLTIQFIVRDKTVFQQCILENRANTNITLELAFCKHMGITDLDHVTYNYEFNETSSNQRNAGPGPGGLSWVHVNRFHEESQDAQTDSRQSTHQGSSSSKSFTRNKGRSNFGVAVVTSIAVNGEMIRFCPGLSPHTWKEVLKAKSKLEIVTAYKLALLVDDSFNWKKFVVSSKEMNMNRLLGEAKAVLLFRTPITRISQKDSLNSDYNNRDIKSLKRVDSDTEVDILNVSQDKIATVEDGPLTKPLPVIDHEPSPEKTSPLMDRIEFAVRRNLQHILDVCAIPVAVRQIGEDASDSVWKELREVQAIALSCGDLSGHRICTTSSFFAFQFLAEVAKRLSRLPHSDRGDTQVQALLSRIKAVCLGHLKWLYAAQKNDEEQPFKSLYWVSGEAVTLPESSDSWAPSDHVRDTAFQIIKAMEFANAFTESENDCPSLVTELISQWGRRWVRWLERDDMRESLTWCHKEDQGLKVFRLDQQVWIWRALKAMEDKRYGACASLDDGMQHRDRGSSAGPEVFDAHQMLRTSRRFSSWTVQRETLMKFTTEHEIMREKMVAISRSPRETRFLFHARDTALLYAEDMGFFTGDASFRQACENTIDIQRFHEINQEARWHNALRYALSIMLGTRGHQINTRKPGDMVRVATEVLLWSSSENGLFPGKLDIVAKSTLDGVFHREQDADSCYEASFEIPYVFLTHSEAIGAIESSLHPGPEVEKEHASFSRDPHATLRSPKLSTEAIAAHRISNPQVQINQREDRDLQKLVTKLSDTLNMLSYLPTSTSSPNFRRSEKSSGDARLTLKKSVPFSNIIDSHNIVEIEDEWVFNYPDFFGSEQDDYISLDDTLDSVANSDATWLKSIDIGEMRQKYSSHGNKDGRADGKSTASSDRTSPASICSDSSISSGSSITWGGPRDSGLRVFDIASRKRFPRKLFKDINRLVMGSFECVWEKMRRPRTMAKAKKRLIIWARSDTHRELEAALLCYAASQGNEKANMLKFFERHFRHENFMFDHCNLAYNNWETELHLGFFILKDASGPLPGDAPLNFEKFPKLQGKGVSRGSMGIRFHGDAFDRYWTCHVFYNVVPEELADKREADTPGRFTSEDLAVQDSVQRKVIELQLVAQMLFHIESCTQTILAEVKSEMGIKSLTFLWAIPSMDTYASWHKIWEGFEPLLQALDDDLVSAQDIIGQWEARQDSRGLERPRWTRNDEKKYRVAITRAQQVVDWYKKRIKDALKDIESLREACTARLENARAELTFRSSQNIASFTYVTIVFLPLGFAASVFGMNGYPDASWVASMAVIAVVTLAITAIALANAKLLLGVAEQLSKDTLEFTGTVFQASLIGQQQQRWRDERVQGSPEPDHPSNGNPKAGNPPNRTTGHAVFWMAYLLIELPARRVALACRELPVSLMQTLRLLRPGARPADTVASTVAPSTASAASIWRKNMRIAGGILLLPLLLISWTIQLLFYNVLDILVFLGRLIRKVFYDLVTISDANGPATNTNILTWLINPPPSLRPMRSFMVRDQKSRGSTAQVDTSAASDRSDPGPHEQV